MPDTTIDLEREALMLLASCRTASLASVDDQGHPHAANIQYAFDNQLRLYFVSSPEAAHSKHIQRCPHVAVTVYDHHDEEPAVIRGLQLHALAHSIDDPVERASALTLYFARFPFVTTDPAMGEAVERQRFYRLTPIWMRLIDNRRGFGWKMEKDLSGK